MISDSNFVIFSYYKYNESCFAYLLHYWVGYIGWITSTFRGDTDDMITPFKDI